MKEQLVARVGHY